MVKYLKDIDYQKKKYLKDIDLDNIYIWKWMWIGIGYDLFGVLQNYL